MRNTNLIGWLKNTNYLCLNFLKFSKISVETFITYQWIEVKMKQPQNHFYSPDRSFKLCAIFGTLTVLGRV